MMLVCFFFVLIVFDSFCVNKLNCILAQSVQSLMCSKDHDNLSSGKKSPDSGKHSSIPSHASAAPSNNDDDFDDLDPRGSSSNSMLLSTMAELVECFFF